RSTPASSPTLSPARAGSSASPPPGCITLPPTSIEAKSTSPRRPLRLDQAPAGVVAHGVARLCVAVEKVERHALVGHLERAVAARDRAQLTGRSRTGGRRRPCGDRQWWPGCRAAAAALADARGVAVEGIDRVVV